MLGPDPITIASSMTILVWFRNDLRIDDHAPLVAAAKRGAPVVPVVCVDLDLPRQTQFGFSRLGPHRARFWLEGLADLRSQLRSLGSDLVVTRGRPEDVLPELVAPMNVEEVHFHRGFAVDERTEEDNLARRCPQVRWQGHWGNLLVTPDQAPFAVSEVPETFTAFRKKIGARAEIPHPRPAPLALPALPPGVEPGTIPTLDHLGLTSVPADARAQITLTGGAAAGRDRVAHYIWREDRLRGYKDTRNGMLAADDSTKFSAWLAHGALSPRWVLEQIRTYEQERVANDSTYWLFFELLWRDYFQYIALKHGARLFKAGGLRGLRLPWRRDPALIDAWCAGETGFPLVDASMKELAATGYTSNRARQNVASFFTKVLGQDWRIGAAWFESQLIDYDPASNWGNWAYAAGVGNDARGFRYFHLPKQARDYDPEGAFVRHWLPALAKVPTRWLPEPYRAPADVQASAGLGDAYPRPIVDLESAVNATRKAYERVDPPAPPSRRRGRRRQ